MLNGGELDGARILSRKTVELMTTNHTGDYGIWLAGPGYGFGLGYAIVTDLGPSGTPRSEGSYYWGGAFGTIFWVDPSEERDQHHADADPAVHPSQHTSGPGDTDVSGRDRLT